MKSRVLLVEDDVDVREVTRRYLEEHAFEVVAAADGRGALDRARDAIDVVVLDLGLPGLDGLEVLRRLRADETLPILIVSARVDGSDRVAGLEMGADDYLTKPFLPRELVARVKALLRRARLPSVESVQRGRLLIDADAHRVTLDGAPVELTPREFDLLRILSGTPGKTFSRDELLDRVWGEEYAGGTRRVDLHVSNLRGKLTRPDHPSPIRSVWGVGYHFEG